MTIPVVGEAGGSPVALSYVIPLRRWRHERPDPLTPYLEWLAARAEIIVIDGSDDELYSSHGATWGHLVTHVQLLPHMRSANGKVSAIVMGVWAASHETIVLADDDVRYDDSALHQAHLALDGCDLVRPQNFFRPLPWHARWDTARTLINRAFGADYPGTLIVRRSTLLAIGGYDGDALFENLELIRTVEAAGGRTANYRSLYVRRLPPSLAHFKGQRTRQAYESFAQPARMAAELSLLPAILVLQARARWATLVGAAIAAVATAEYGRRRDHGRAVFPATASLLAPAWLVERALCSWFAIWHRIHGGLPYAGVTFRKAANSTRTLRGRHEFERP